MRNSKLYVIPRAAFRRVTPGQGTFFAGAFIAAGLVLAALIIKGK